MAENNSMDEIFKKHRPKQLRFFEWMKRKGALDEDEEVRMKGIESCIQQISNVLREEPLEASNDGK